MSDDSRSWSRAELETELRRLEALADARATRSKRAVSWRTVAAFMAAIDAEVGGARVDRLLEAGGVDPDDLRARRTGWASWTEHNRLLGALDPLREEGVARRAGATAVESPFLRFLPLAVGAQPPIEQILRWSVRVAVGPRGLLLRGCTAQVRRRSDDTLEIRFTPPPGHHLPDFWLELAAGAVEHLLSLAGARAAVSASHRGRSADLEVEILDARRGERLRALLRGPTGNVGVAIEQVRDELRQRNDELRERIEELEASERGRATLHKQLSRRHEMEAVGRLAGGIAHDFNNLLTAMVGQATVLARTARDERVRADVSTLLDAAMRAADLSRRLLVMGRRQPLELEVLPLDPTLASWRTTLESAAGEPVHVEMDLGAPDACVEVDAVQLERALVELTLNAGEALRHGGELKVATSVVELDAAFQRAHPGSPVGPMARLAIRHRGAQERSAEAHKLDLGALTASYGLATELGGTLSVSAEPSQGTTVAIFLPLAEATA